MRNRLIQLAQLDLFLQRMGLFRWLIRVFLLITLISALISGGRTSSSILFGLFFVFLPLGVLTDLFRMFLRLEVSREESRQAKARTAGLTYALARILAHSGDQVAAIWHFLLQDEGVSFVLLRLGVHPDTLKKMVLNPPQFREWITSGKQLAQTQGRALAPEHLFEVLQETPPLQSLWQELAITASERQEVWQWYYRTEEKVQKARRGFIDNLKFSGGIGRDWSSGYTHALELYAENITSSIERLGHPISLVGHQAERKQILEYLSRDRQHNAIILGEEGIGKQRLVFALASDFIAGKVPLPLRYKHIYMVDVGRLVTARSESELTANLRAVLDEASTVGNVVLAIPDFELLVGGQKSEALGIVDASAILAPYLQSSAIQILASTTQEAYYRYIKPNAALAAALLSVEVKEISSADALRVLEEEVFRYESKTKRFFTHQALRKVIEIAEQHIHDIPYPEKGLQLLDEVAGAMADASQQVIFPKDVERIVSQKLKVPIGVANKTDRDVLNNLEHLISERVVGQREAVKVVANALRRARAGLHSGKRPIGTFLFLGPTGVGKTEMAKTIAALYYRNDKAFIRLDMSEYQTPESLEKLVGSTSSPGLLTTAITDQPFSVVLLDEIEKADTSVRNLFLQILDEGHVTDGYGKKVDFTNAMIIATSNAGAEVIRQAVQDNQVDASFKPRLIDWLQSQGIFSPEWINRFDAVVVFLPLSKAEIREVAELQIADLIGRLKTHNIDLSLNDDVYDVLIEKGYDPQFGARPMRRAVQDIVESALAKALLHESTEGPKKITLTKEMLDEKRDATLGQVT